LKFDKISKLFNMKKLTIFMALIAFTLTTYAQDKWSVDPYHSSVNFAVKHSNISMVNGKFLEYTGTMNTKGEVENLENASFEFMMQSQILDTYVEAID